MAIQTGGKMSNKTAAKTGAMRIDPGPKIAPPRAPARVACKMSIPPRSTCPWRRIALPIVPESVEKSGYVHIWIYQGTFLLPSLSCVFGMHGESNKKMKTDIKEPTTPMRAADALFV
jgi:hypothetical protein